MIDFINLLLSPDKKLGFITFGVVLLFMNIEAFSNILIWTVYYLWNRHKYDSFDSRRIGMKFRYFMDSRLNTLTYLTISVDFILVLIFVITSCILHLYAIH